VHGEPTIDALFDGALHFRQPKRGYRVNIDSVLLASFARAGGRARSVVDLGAGVGAVTLSLAHLGGLERASLVERDPELATLCEQNLSAQKIRGQVVVADLNRGLPDSLAGSADLVVCNPPFFEPGERRPAASERETARAGKLAPFLCSARRALGRGRGRAVFVYPARSLARLIGSAESVGLVAKRMRMVHGLPDDPARLALVELKPGKPGGLVVERPLFEWKARAVRSEELASLLMAPRGGRT